MKYQSIKFLVASIFMILAFTSFQGCVKGEFDEPPVGGEDPAIPEDQIVSYADVLGLWVPGEFTQLNMDKYLKTVVVADDESGNFYKTLILKDETSGLGVNIAIDDVELHNLYPEGRRIFINLSELWVGDNNNLPQIGYTPFDNNGRTQLGRIPAVLKEEVITKGMFGIEVTPTVKRINELTASDLNTLVKIENAQFALGSAGVPYANSVNPSNGVNHTLEDCDGQRIIVRTSDYSDFAALTTPEGSGSLTAVFGVFGSDRQLTFRSLDDVQMNNDRCGDSGGTNERVNIGDLRTAWANGDDGVGNKFVEGIVVTDYTTGSHNRQNLSLQDETGAITLRFDDEHSYALGSKLKVNVAGQNMSEFNGLLQISNLAFGLVTEQGNEALPAVETTIQNIMDNFEDLESSRVLIKGVTLTGSGTFAGNLTLNDGTGTIESFTFNTATFANDPVPSGAVDAYCIVSQFNDPQVLFNNSTDVSGGGGSGGDEEKIDILELRGEFNSGGTSVEEAYIEGTVISDVSSGNTTARNMFLQDGSAGIIVRFTADHSFSQGQKVKVVVSNLELSEFNGALQVNNVPVGNATVTGSSSITPQEVTVSDILNNLEEYESELVLIKDVTLSGSGSYSGSVTVSQNGSDITLFTRTGATFAGSSLPTEATDLIAVVTEFETPQLFIRNLEDVDGDGGGGGNGTPINVDFQNQTNNEETNIAGWDNIATKGTRTWLSKDFMGNLYSQATAFNDMEPAMETWFVSPKVNTSELTTLSFESAKAFYTHAGLTVWVSEDYSGNPATASWTKVDARVAVDADEDHTFISSGDIDLTSYGSDINIGFKYEGNGGSNTGTFRIDNISIK